MSGGAWACAHASTGSRLRRIFDSTTHPAPGDWIPVRRPELRGGRGRMRGCLGVGGDMGTLARDIRLSNCCDRADIGFQ